MAKIEEDVPANCASGGAVAGIGVGKDGEPGVDKKKRKKDADDVVMGMIRRKLNKKQTEE